MVLLLDSIKAEATKVIPCGVLRLFNVQTDRCRVVENSARRGVDSNTRDMHAFYDNLITNPDADLTFNMEERRADGSLTGRQMRKTTSVKQLVNLSPDWRDTTRRLERVLARASDITTANALSPEDKQVLLTGAWVRVTSQTRDPRLAEPRGLLRAPWGVQAGQYPDPYHPSDERQVPGWYPQISRDASMVSYTPRVLDQNVVPTERLRVLYTDLVTAVFQYLKSRNTVAQFHPLVAAAQSHIFPCRGAYSNFAGETGAQAINSWEQENGDPRYLLQNTVLGMRFPDGDPNQGPLLGARSYAAQWNYALDKRIPVTVGAESGGYLLSRGAWDDGDSLRSWPIWTADPLLELLRWINVARMLLASGDASIDGRATMVDLFAATTLYNGAQVRAYEQIPAEYGSNVVGFRAKIAAEAQARKNRERNVGVPGYNSTGDDTADIAMGTIGTVSLAITDALKTGNIAVGVVSFVIRGFMLLYGFLNGPDAIRDPYAYPIRMGSGKSPAIPGLSMTNALQNGPCFRYNP